MHDLRSVYEDGFWNTMGRKSVFSPIESRYGSQHQHCRVLNAHMIISTELCVHAVAGIETSHARENTSQSAMTGCGMNGILRSISAADFHRITDYRLRRYCI